MTRNIISRRMISWLGVFKSLTILELVTQVICLKDMRISVPEAIAVGDTVTLSCYFDLENAALYSVRWYLEQEEFYRFVPKETPPARVFPTAGIVVDTERSTENSVILRSVTRSQSGSYQCEVSADAPLFHTETKAATMLVAELPESEPVITIYGMPGADNKRVVTLGETFKASCVSGPSYPPVNFTWIVNGIRFPSTHSGLRGIESENDINSKEAWSELLVVVDNHFLSPPHNRILSVRCETNIYSLYRGAAEAELNIIEDNYWTFGGKVSPTIDQRGNRGDPDNSALTGHGIRLSGIKLKCILLEVLLLLITFGFVGGRGWKRIFSSS